MIGARLRPRTGRRRVEVITFVVSVALLSGMGTGLRSLFGEPPLDAFLSSAIGALGILGGLALGGLARRRLQRRRVRRGHAEVVVRDRGRAHRGLHPRWQTLTARPGPGRLGLTEAGFGVLAGGPLDLPVLAARRTGRWTGPRDWTVWPNLAVLELTTPTGAVELGIHDEHVAWLLAQLGLAEDVSDGGARVRP
ncbi:hypothetical protein [Cellulomonas marina]|uniref:Uncharacterized protein n=1 Tax=Cellulomonas marina TaxID=988821 RepID=A0A1I0Z313_9CELL|nr:hypothetical protein [Cellulomonas marina]GIG28179.1 hypothetical protein Cma02nite_07790 [Cellulomonas marina]SFB19486.1 hypothetical protein SAMN05421867_109119 [Cellulomonas marina]